MADIFVSADRLRAPVKAEADGTNTIITGVPGKRIAVTGYNLTVDVTISSGAFLTIEDDTPSTPTILGYLNLAAGNPASYADVYDPAFITASGQGLVINNPNGVNTYGHLNYILIT